MPKQKFKAGDRVKLNQEYFSNNEDEPEDSGTVAYYNGILVYVKWDSTSYTEWVYEQELDLEIVSRVVEKSPTRLKISGSQLGRAIILLRRYNPGPISGASDNQVRDDIIDHARRVYNGREWGIGSSYFSATMGYFLNFWTVDLGDVIEVRCEVLIDPGILLIDDVDDVVYEF